MAIPPAPETDAALDAPAGVVVRLSPLTRRVVAPNPSVFTYTGTCSYVLGSGEIAIIDPGPAIDAHIAALLHAIKGETLKAILVTHTHRDHSPAARVLRAMTGAPIFGCAAYEPRVEKNPKSPNLDASHDRDYAPDRALADGEKLRFGGATIEAIATPGHTANHICFALIEERAVFTGDHVMAWATTVIAPPDGSMRDYMRSLEKLRLRDDAILWPAHGGPVRDPPRYLRALIHHRNLREAAILQRLGAGDETIPQIVSHIYEGVDERLLGAAAMTVFAHIEDLCERKFVVTDETPTLFAHYRRA